jgi:hypothetical protein
MSIFYQLCDRPSSHSVVLPAHPVSHGRVILQSGLDTLLLGLGTGREHLLEEYVVRKMEQSEASRLE